jgi:Acetyltransferase (GNAT) domain
LKELIFIEGPLPPEFKSDFESFLFNEPNHRRTQTDQPWSSFHYVTEEKKRSLASVHFILSGGIAQSPFKAPFGSILFSEKITPEDLFDFVRHVQDNLKLKGIKKIRIKNPPQAYHPDRAAVLEVLLLNSGFTVVDAEINTSIPVDRTSFEKRVFSGEQRKLKQSKKNKLRFQEIFCTKELVREVYEFILSCRQERGQSLSMTLDDLRKTIETCPRSFFLFGVYDKDVLVAASITIRVNKRILYNFYPAHSRAYDQFSPAVLLTKGIYEWCQAKDISLLDLGTSALNGKPNFGLLNFKRHLGGAVSTKFSFEKDLT